MDSTGNSQHPLDALLGAANEIDQAAAENEGLARQHSLFLAQSMSQKMADEEQEKKELVESQKASMQSKIDEMFTLEQMSLT